MSNKAELKRRQAFLADIHAAEQKHGYRLVVLQANPQITIQPLTEPVDGTAREKN